MLEGLFKDDSGDILLILLILLLLCSCGDGKSGFLDGLFDNNIFLIFILIFLFGGIF